MACLSGSAFYSVIHPQSLEMMGGAQVVFVGDVLVLGESFKITNGEKLLKKIGDYKTTGFNSGKYYLVGDSGSFELTQTYDKKESKAIYTANQPPRARDANGCADFRRPASEGAGPAEVQIKK